MGGHGGLNILQQKSWHVWKADNIEKVEKDEEEHRAQVQKEKSRQRDIRGEMRYAKLKGKHLNKKEAMQQVDSRRRKRKHEGEASESEFEKAILTIQNKRRKLNPDEMRAAEELKMKELEGMRLGNSSVELNQEKPWWTLSGEKKEELDLSLASKGPFYKEKKSLMKLRVQASLRKHAEDPFTNLQRAMGKKPEMNLEEDIHGKNAEAIDSSKHEKKKKKKEKKKKKKKKKKDDYEELRKLRERRERKERKKADLLRRGRR